MAEAVNLRVDGADYGGWTAVQVQRSIETAAMAFTLQVTERWAEARRRPILPGSACELKLGDDLVMRGHVDAIGVDYDATSHTVRVSGRDRVGDLVDCTAVVDEAHEWLGLGLLEVAGRLCQPYGVQVRAEVELGAIFPRLALQPGETAFEALERACRARAVLANGDGLGGLVLTRAGRGGRMPGALRLGQDTNVLSAQGSFDYSGRYSLVVVRGQQEGADGLAAADVAGPEARVTDPDIQRYRPTVLLAESQGNGVTLAQRAAWALRVGVGRSRRVTYTVQGWRNEAGNLWRPNSLIQVKDEYLDLSRELLIVGITLTLDEQGTRSELELAPADAFALIPEEDLPDPVSASSGGSSSGGGGAGPFSLWDGS